MHRIHIGTQFAINTVQMYVTRLTLTPDMAFMKRFLSVFAIAALSAASAQAQTTTLLNDNFNSEFGGLSKLNYTGFANWDVTGQVDLVKGGDYSITCGGSCIDLDGSSGPGALRTKIAYSFAAGDVMKISFDVGGSQRVSGASDNFTFGMVFGTVTNIAGCSSVLLGCVSGSGISAFSSGSTINSAAVFSTRSLEFTAGTAGTVTYSFGTTSADNIGPLLDNVLITRTSTVPEPSTWALMIAGLGALGVAAKRRRA